MRIICFLFLLSFAAVAEPIIIDGKEIDVPVVVEDGRTMIELRGLADELGWQLEFRNGRAVVATKARPTVSPVQTMPANETFIPGKDSVGYNQRPEIAARFTQVLGRAKPFQLFVNGKDVTAEAVQQVNEIRWRPKNRLGGGLHKVELTAYDLEGRKLHREWSFQIKNRLSY